MPRRSTAALRVLPRPDNLQANERAFARHLLAEGKAPKTVVVYTWAVRRLHDYLQQNNMPVVVADIDREHVESFMVSERDRFSPATRNQTFRSLQAFWKYLIAEGEVASSPLQTISPPSIPDNPPGIVSLDQMRHLLRVTDGTSFADRRDTAILLLLYGTGMRRGEIAGLRLGDIDLDAREALVTGKFSRQRIIKYGRDASRALDRYLRVRAKHRDAELSALWLGERGALGPSGMEQLIKRRVRQAGLTGISAHRFRHAFADAYLSSGGNEGDLMQQAGWRTRAMVDRYARGVAAERARRNFDDHDPLDRLRRG